MICPIWCKWNLAKITPFWDFRRLCYWLFSSTSSNHFELNGSDRPLKLPQNSSIFQARHLLTKKKNETRWWIDISLYVQCSKLGKKVQFGDKCTIFCFKRACELKKNVQKYLILAIEVKPLLHLWKNVLFFVISQQYANTSMPSNSNFFIFNVFCNRNIIWKYKLYFER